MRGPPAWFQAHAAISERNGHFLCKVARSEGDTAEMGLKYCNLLKIWVRWHHGGALSLSLSLSERQCISSVFQAGTGNAVGLRLAVSFSSRDDEQKLTPVRSPCVLRVCVMRVICTGSAPRTSPVFSPYLFRRVLRLFWRFLFHRYSVWSILAVWHQTVAREILNDLGTSSRTLVLWGTEQSVSRCFVKIINIVVVWSGRVIVINILYYTQILNCTVACKDSTLVLLNYWTGLVPTRG